MSIYKNIKRMVKQMRCSHSHVWSYYPEECFYKGSAIKGNIKIDLCWKCGSIVNVINYGQ